MPDVNGLLQSRFVSGPNDELAVQDIYDIIRPSLSTGVSNSSGLEIRSALAQGLRITDSSFPRFSSPTSNLVQDLLSTLKLRVDSFLNLMPFDLRNNLSQLDMTYTLDDLGYARLDSVWDYFGKQISIDSNDHDVYRAARSSVSHLKQTGALEGNDRPNQIMDHGAESLVYGRLVQNMIGASINPPVKDVIHGLSSDESRRSVSESAIPTALNPNGLDGPSPKQATISDFEALSPSIVEGAPYQPQKNIAPKFVGQPPKRIDGDPWASREEQTNRNPNRPNWTKRPGDAYLDAFGPSKDSVVANAEPDLAPGVRDYIYLASRVERTTGRGFDMALVQSLIDFTTPERLISRFPGMIGMILYYYQLPAGEFELETEYKQLVGLMDRLKPDWSSSQRSNQTIGLLLHLAKASQDSIFVLSTYEDSTYKEAALIASGYRYNDIFQLLKSQYPMAGV